MLTACLFVGLNGPGLIFCDFSFTFFFQITSTLPKIFWEKFGINSLSPQKQKLFLIFVNGFALMRWDIPREGRESPSAFESVERGDERSSTLGWEQVGDWWVSLVVGRTYPHGQLPKQRGPFTRDVCLEHSLGSTGLSLGPMSEGEARELPHPKRLGPWRPHFIL